MRHISARSEKNQSPKTNAQAALIALYAAQRIEAFEQIFTEISNAADDRHPQLLAEIGHELACGYIRELTEDSVSLSAHHSVASYAAQCMERIEAAFLAILDAARCHTTVATLAGFALQLTALHRSEFEEEGGTH
ncbi:MAG: hypothetical protein JO067_01615 [Cupriavidus sp.]|nr:hypothetical protein [Cupriavidus sp.]